MPVISQDSTRFTDVVAYELEPQLSLCRESIVINDPTAQTYKVGAVLGKITATGKYRLSLSASVDGSQTPAAIYIADGMGSSTDLPVAANTDTKALVLARGPVLLIDAGLQLGTGTTLAAVKTAFAPLQITVETAV